MNKEYPTESSGGQFIKVFFNIFEICSSELENEYRVEFFRQIEDYQRPHFRNVTSIATPRKVKIYGGMQPENRVAQANAI